MWNVILECLNKLGGLFGAISLIFSMYIYASTGQIKRNIKKILEYNAYEEWKKSAIIALEEILKLLKDRKVSGEEIWGKINQELAGLETYSIYFDANTKKCVNNLKREMKKDTYNRNRAELMEGISKVIGYLKLKDTFMG